ncbi:MAG: excinuclease ABC subunit UvrA [Chloroflexi bacterium]|nr:excinuclease ABC subunit UvrA [Chloroflexota bacterium]
MPLENIVVKGAREHNLKNIDVVIPRNKFVVLTGVSGSGKSSLAFDTIYAEGQRRYVESLSAYARQFLGRMEKPDVDYIEGLSPAISIDQKGVSHNPRSTVGTVTEVYDYLRLLFARVGKPHCPKCSRPVQKQTVQQMVDAVFALPADRRIMLLAPKVRHRKGEHKEIFEEARKAGFNRLQVDSRVYEMDEATGLTLDKNKWHDIDIVVDRLLTGEGLEHTRVADSVETALKQGGGVLVVHVLDDNKPKGQDILFSEHFSCVYCGISLPEIEPRSFSFNSPYGACSECTGLGIKLEIDPDLVIPNREMSLAEGAVIPWVRAGSSSPWYMSLLESLARSHGFSTRVPVKALPQSALELVLYGNRGREFEMRHQAQSGRLFTWETTFEGVIPNLQRRYRETESDYIRSEIERYMARRSCPSCQGKRLKPEALAVKVCGESIMNVCALTIEGALAWARQIRGEGSSTDSQQAQQNGVLSPRDMLIARQVFKEIEGRLKFLLGIGLEYLTLDRAAYTLSGGEAQRIRLATQIGSGLMGVLYVCDEPSVGLHAADDYRLIETLKQLRDLGNTIIVVEHDEAIIRSADWIVDLGPGAGEHGGRVVAAGTIEDIKASPDSITGAYLAGRRRIPMPAAHRDGNGLKLTVKGARENNLKSIDVEFPLGKLVCVTGVSGSGKSTLVYEVLYKKLAQLLYGAKDKPGECDAILGLEHVDKVINIDQSPIGRTPRSNPATYTGAFTPIRDLFATLPEARARGYKPGRFSFNVKGGRCEACGGEGYIEIEMQFLPDVTVPCEVCKGARYNREALDILFKGKSIAEVLDMTVDEALELFWNLPKIRAKLETLRDVGLGYIHLGQPATTLSGGEAQRVKLSTELSRRATGRTLYILDEPTTGLSLEDCVALMRVLHRLVDAGNTVILIEHHLDFIKNADWVVDLGPGPGEKGGWVVAIGTPEEVVQMPQSITGQYMKRVLERAAAVST